MTVKKLLNYSVISFTLIVVISQQLRLQTEESSEFKGAYHSQDPPGIIPEVFAKGIISREGFED